MVLTCKMEFVQTDKMFCMQNSQKEDKSTLGKFFLVTEIIEIPI